LRRYKVSAGARKLGLNGLAKPNGLRYTLSLNVVANGIEIIAGTQLA